MKWSEIVMFTYLTRFQLLAWRWRVVQGGLVPTLGPG